MTVVPDSYVFALDGNDVLFAKGDTVYRVGKDGSCTSSTCPAPVAQAQGKTAGSIALDASYIYWIATGAGTSVWRADKDGKNATKLYDNANDSAPGNLVADDTAIYWAVQTPGTVYRLAK